MTTPGDISECLDNEFIHTACRIGFEPKDFKALAQDEHRLRKVLSFIRGDADIVVLNHVIDCDAEPTMPSGWSVPDHCKLGLVKWDPKNVELYLSEDQHDGKYIEGHKLRVELASKIVLNANILEYLLNNPCLISEDWKKDERGNTRFIFFWGTIYCHSDGDLCVRYLYFDGRRWCADYARLGCTWSAADPAAVLSR
jgi:hypothetical protein